MRVRRTLGWLLTLCGALALLIAAYYIFDYVRERQALVEFLDQRVAGLPEASDIALVDDLVAYMGRLPDGETTHRMGYANPLYAFLKARPIDVLRNGGFCGNKARLLVTLFHLRGIPSRVNYVYNVEGWNRPELGQPYVTAFVEVRLEDRWAVIDPYIAVLFRRADGSPATAADLAADPELIRMRAPKWYKPELFNFREIRGIRWGKFPAGEQVRTRLAAITSDAFVNELRYPFWAHRPNLLIALTTGLVGAAALVFGRGLLRGGAARASRAAAAT
ncbi:MAG TPA: transglutaminase-like domain-containing protein [Dongiaceae bacterium]|nr:transglutaminase-like domain-containing protein [Dongiaceae bacterium]